MIANKPFANEKHQTKIAVNDQHDASLC